MQLASRFAPVLDLLDEIPYLASQSQNNEFLIKGQFFKVTMINMGESCLLVLILQFFGVQKKDPRLMGATVPILLFNEGELSQEMGITDYMRTAIVEVHRLAELQDSPRSLVFVIFDDLLALSNLIADFLIVHGKSMDRRYKGPTYIAV